MTIARRELVDVNVTRWYHCISRCVRSAFLLSDDASDDRKQWIEDRLEKLARNFAVSVGGFAVMDNHLHVLCRLDPDDAMQWSSEEVVRRWIAIYPPRHLTLDDPQVVDAWVANQARDTKRVAQLRERLSDLGWFMKSLKEPLSRMANKADGCRGAFWDARYKSIAILDEEALLATCAYIDLNPVAAGIAETPEQSQHTSVRQRVQHVRRQNKLDSLKAARQGTVAGSRAAENLEQNHWLVPIEDRSSIPSAGSDAREGILETFSLGSYLLLVDYTGRLYLRGKARLNSAVREIFDRLQTNSDYWSELIGKMLRSQQLRGHIFSVQSGSAQTCSRNRGQPMATLNSQVV